MPYVRSNKNVKRWLKIKRISFVVLLCFLAAASMPFMTSLITKHPETLLRWFARQAFYKRAVDFQNPGSQLSIAAKEKGGKTANLTIGGKSEDDIIGRYAFRDIIPPVNPIYNYISLASFIILSSLVVRRYVLRKR